MTMTPGADRLHIVTLAPGHFHAALIQKEALAELADEAFVYAPLGADLSAHLNRIAGFNNRQKNPTRWKLRVYAGCDYWERMLEERPGQVVVLSGINRGKIDRIAELAARGLHVLADKPWIIEAADMPKLEAAFDAAARTGAVIFDGMTQRFEITALVQRELVSDPEIFGEPLPGSPEDPAVTLESVHCLLKLVAGVPNQRPAWYFDIHQQGEGLADVGTHLVDQVQWILFPEQALDYRADIRVLGGSRRPTIISEDNFRRVTGERGFPDFLHSAVRPDGLHYFCNNTVTYTLRGIHVKMDVRWDFEAPPEGGGDSETAVFRGSRASVEVRQGREENFRPEVYVVPCAGAPDVSAALSRRVAALEQRWPGVAVEPLPGRFRIAIPHALRIGHEAHFALLIGRFLQYVKNPGTMPAWEAPGMLSKYYVTTKGVELARKEDRCNADGSLPSH
jgi:predicted dehydrogenase